jgi:hypothetical protein
MITQSRELGVFLEGVGRRARESRVFGEVTIGESMVSCAAPASAAPAFYRVGLDQGRLWVELVTDNRWLSQSIEQDLVHTGDKIEDLVDEELTALGFEGGPLPIQHYRSEDKLFTFRSPLPIDGAHLARSEAQEVATTCLLAYEAAFRDLGDMETDEED